METIQSRRNFSMKKILKMGDREKETSLAMADGGGRSC